MKKNTLDVTPIYKGEMNMTPQRKEEIMRAAAYVERNAVRKAERRTFLINAAWITMSVLFLLYFIQSFISMFM